jgi:hypothetical protein
VLGFGVEVEPSDLGLKAAAEFGKLFPGRPRWRSLNEFTPYFRLCVELALALAVSSRKVSEMAAERPSFIASLSPISLHGIIPAAGGVIVVGNDGAPTGAVGVTGDSSDNDEICALAGISAAGLAMQS